MTEVEHTKKYGYKIEISKLPSSEGGGYLAIVPRLPGCMSDGDSPQEALKNVEDAISCWIETASELGREIPIEDEYKVEDDFSGKLTLRMPKSLHKMVTEQAEQEGCSINQLIMMYISMGLGNEFGKNQVSINFDASSDIFQKMINKQWKNHVPVENNRNILLDIKDICSDDDLTVDSCSRDTNLGRGW
jgi:antitoxin HicB